MSMYEVTAGVTAGSPVRTDGATPFEKFHNLNRSLVPGSVYVTPDGTFGVKTDDGRVLSFGENGAADVTDIAEIVNHVEIRTQSDSLQPKDLFVFNQTLYQVIEDKGITIDAFCFDTKNVVTVSPERLAFMGNVRAIGVVFMPEARAFGGNMFQALKMLTASAGNREGLYELRKKEWLAAQQNGTSVTSDGLDEMLALVSNPGAVQFQSLMAVQQQTAVLANIANSLNALVRQQTPVPDEQRPDPAADAESSSRA